jgi:hypothetical protein
MIPFGIDLNIMELATPLYLEGASWAARKDGNGDPIPDFPQGILLLGDEGGGELIPMEMELVG